MICMILYMVHRYASSRTKVIRHNTNSVRNYHYYMIHSYMLHNAIFIKIIISYAVKESFVFRTFI